MNDITHELEHSVEADVSSSFAWDWRTDIKNWADPPAQFRLDGPFASGSWGTTLLPGCGRALSAKEGVSCGWVADYARDVTFYNASNENRSGNWQFQTPTPIRNQQVTSSSLVAGSKIRNKFADFDDGATADS